MNVFYEDGGDFKAAAVLADQAGSLQIETPHGKRTKIKSSNVLLRFSDCSAAELMRAAQHEAEEIPLDFLWEASGTEEFAFDTLARDYYGPSPSAAQSAAIALRLHSAPMYFYRKGRGRYRAAPAESLQAALAGQQRREAQAAQIDAWKNALLARELPDPLRARLDMLLYTPDKNALEWKALDAAATAAGTTPVRVIEQCGGLPSTADYHLRGFLVRHFPAGTGFAPVHTGTPPQLAAADTEAFSIDDASTTEIDDAFSLVNLAGELRVGVHIAAPALGIERDSALDQMARDRMSTVYLPGHKITMLPDSCIADFSLDAGSDRPAVSLYLYCDPDTLGIRRTETRLERVYIADNLRLNLLGEGLDGGAHGPRWAKALQTLHRLAEQQQLARGKPANTQTDKIDYSFHVDGERIQITPRPRGSPLDTLVSELMILANSTWGQALDEAGFAAIYRSQTSGKTRMGTQPAPHQGLNVSHYAWSSSPLRRYADLVNQRQIVALAKGDDPVYRHREDALFSAVRDFELAYDAYAEFQRHMERYWCLRYLIQENIDRLEATLIRDDLVRVSTLPLVMRARDLPLCEPGTPLTLTVEDIDLIEVSCVLRAN